MVKMNLTSNVNPTYTCWSRYGAGLVRVQRISKSTNNRSRNNNNTGGIKSPKKRILKGDDPFASEPTIPTEKHIGTSHDVIV